MRPYRVVLADDHAMFRQGVKRILKDAENLEVIGEASDGLELLEVSKETTPDMVILDISMPNLRGLEATREIKTRFQATISAPNGLQILLSYGPVLCRAVS